MVKFNHNRVGQDCDDGCTHLARYLKAKGFNDIPLRDVDVRNVQLQCTDGTHDVMVAQDCLFRALIAVAHSRALHVSQSPFDPKCKEVIPMPSVPVLRQYAVQHGMAIVDNKEHAMHRYMKSLHDAAQVQWQQQRTEEERLRWGNSFRQRWAAGMQAGGMATPAVLVRC